ncbi:UNVERIFIED_CONTAM: hypothetical protein FKN15_059275 [Acipenser sinensis]
MEDPADSGGGGTATSAGPSMLVTEIHCSAGARPLRLLEWKVKPGSHVNIDSVLAVCIPIPVERQAGTEPRDPPGRQAEKKVKSDRAGVVRELCCQPGQVISPGGILVRIEECTHPVVMKGLCAECGQDLTQLQNKNGKQQTPISTANVSMVHSVPELMVSSEQAEQLGREDQHRLYRNRKLVLMVDLDQTLIHTTEQHCKQMSNKAWRIKDCASPVENSGTIRCTAPFRVKRSCHLPERGRSGGVAIPGANNVNKPNEGSEPASSAHKESEEVKVSAVEEHSNGLRKRIKEQNGNKNMPADDSTSKSDAASSQDKANERIHSGGECTSVADASRVNYSANVREHHSGSTQQDSGRTIADKPLVKIAGGDSVANDFDFDLSSDSESEHDSGAGKASSNSDSEGKNSCKRAKKLQSMQPEQEKSKINTVGENHSGEKQVDPEDQVCDIQLDNDQNSPGGLGNGCREKKEAETESQNSEQSGVTMGESLDQSMEEEEEEEEDLDRDDHLIYLEEVLARIHMEYYARYDRYLKKELPEAPDIRKIVPELKSKGLAGTIIVFSGLYPTNYPMERTRECYHAVALGAKISKHLVLNAKDPNRTTHLIAARPGK